MKRGIIIIACILMSFIGFTSCGTDKGISSKIGNDASVNEDYSYTLEGKEGIKDEDLAKIKVRLDKIYGYFNREGYETKELKVTLSDYTKFKREKGEIIITRDIDDFELMEIIMQYEFTEYANYGLMYGVMHDIAKTEELEFDKVKKYSPEEINASWNGMNISYINFISDVASKAEMNMSKYASVQVVEYVEEEYGSEFLFGLLTDSAHVSKIHRVDEVIKEWMNVKYPEYPYELLDLRTVFNQRSPKDTVELKSENIEWVIDLNTREMDPEIPNIYDSAMDFYGFIAGLYYEMDRVESLLDYSIDELPLTRIILYVKDDEYDGIFYDENEIRLKYIGDFSELFITYADMKTRGKAVHWAINLMRGVYYSRESEINKIYVENYFLNLKYFMDESQKEEDIEYKCLVKIEEYFDREINVEDEILHNDLWMKEYCEEVGSFPGLYSRNEGDLRDFYLSFMSFLVREYGEEAFDTITIENKLPDGSKKHIDTVIEEWKEYIINLSEEDFEGYYK